MKSNLTSTSLPRTIQITYPSSFSEFLDGLNFIQLDFMRIMPLSCVLNIDYVNNLIFITMAPIILLIVVGLAFLLQLFVVKRELRRSICHEDDSESRDAAVFKLASQIHEEALRIRRRFIYIFLLLTYLILPTVTTTIFRMFPCQNVDPSDEGGTSNYYLIVGESNSTLQNLCKKWNIDLVLMKRLSWTT